MNQPTFERVIASYHRARFSERLFDSFYEIFMHKSKEIAAMFATTDFPHQKLMLRESILEMLVFYQTGQGDQELKKLADRHRRLKVTDRHFSLWMDSLCEALALHDPEFSPELEQDWRRGLAPGLEIMRGESE